MCRYVLLTASKTIIQRRTINIFRAENKFLCEKDKTDIETLLLKNFIFSKKKPGAKGLKHQTI